MPKSETQVMKLYCDSWKVHVNNNVGDLCGLVARFGDIIVCEGYSKVQWVHALHTHAQLHIDSLARFACGAWCTHSYTP